MGAQLRHLAVALFVSLAIAAPPLFDSEKIQLSNADLSTLSPVEAALFGSDRKDTQTRSQRKCKVYPGDSEWPADWAWTALNKIVDDRLLTPRPHAEVCYAGPSYNAAKCDDMTANWTNNSYIHMPDPIEMLSPVYQGLTCMPPKIYDSKACTMGGFPIHVVNATTPKHVQAAVLFARTSGVRLVVKNTGHDFSGKSGGAESLSIWTHYMKDIRYIEEYKDPIGGYKGPAFKCGSGVQAFEVYKAAYEKGRVVVGGEGQTVGVMGGYIQGGGHSPLSSIYGTGSDNVLAFEVVTPSGAFVTADSTHNTDLFWALRGGGGSTFGIVTSVIVKAHPDARTTAARFTFTSQSAGSNDTFWAGVRAYADSFINNADAGTYAYSVIIPNATSGVLTFQMTPFFAFNKSLTETTALLDPWFKRLDALHIPRDAFNITESSSYYPAWRDFFPLEAVQKTNVQTGSRLWPRANFAPNSTLLEQTFQNIRGASERNRVQVFFNIRAPAQSTSTATGVNPAWREVVLFNLRSARWPATASADEILNVRRNFTLGEMASMQALSPGAGSYLGESDRMEVGWQQSFYGSAYEGLRRVKEKWDPQGVFWVKTGVGSEGWDVVTANGLPGEFGKLCRV